MIQETLKLIKKFGLKIKDGMIDFKDFIEKIAKPKAEQMYFTRNKEKIKINNIWYITEKKIWELIINGNTQNINKIKKDFNTKEVIDELFIDKEEVKSSESQNLIFLNYENRDFTILRTIDNKLYFKGIDIALSLEYKDCSTALLSVNPRYKFSFKELSQKSNLSEKDKFIAGKTTYLNISGALELIMRSKNKNAVKMQEWVLEDVLPTIFRTGKYEVFNDNAPILYKSIHELNNRKSFYIIRIDKNVNYFKFGITINMGRRIGDHRKVFPNAEIVHLIYHTDIAYLNKLECNFKRLLKQYQQNVYFNNATNKFLTEEELIKDKMIEYDNFAGYGTEFFKTDKDNTFENIKLHLNSVIEKVNDTWNNSKYVTDPEVNKKITSLSNDFNNFKGDIDTMKGDIDTVKGDIDTMKEMMMILLKTQNIDTSLLSFNKPIEETNKEQIKEDIIEPEEEIINKCIDCGTKVNGIDSRCIECSNIQQKLNYKKKKSNKVIIDLSTKNTIKKQESINIKSCNVTNLKNHKKVEKKCLDCDKLIRNKSERCEKCYNVWLVQHNRKTRSKPKNVCPDCNKQITRTSKKCDPCYKKQLFLENIKNRPKYSVLIKEVRNLGYTTTGKKYNVSDKSIKKWITKYENYKLLD
uniref:Bro-N domain-containing protein n=1 Tax=viral metagenome TaxID=1070528 RepID=A0A6C0AD22_9ZZZZ